MERSMESQTKPEFAAGTDPAYIPGLTAPVPARTEDDEAGATAEAEDGDADVQDAVPAVTGGETAAGKQAAEPADDATADVEPGHGQDVSEGAPEGGTRAGSDDGDESGAPVFEVSDRRGSIRVDKEGIRFTLDDQEAEFDWSEISAVEVKTARTARRFTLTVHLSARRWFNGEVVAESRSRLKEWPEELDVVLDAYFEES
ncbi:hypothetical protein OG233_06120 [Streptomyces sp. NBC_01218]|nr:hypothetical protein OG233_06120 [Streptomyces sp. NBC_01218]